MGDNFCSQIFSCLLNEVIYSYVDYRLGRPSCRWEDNIKMDLQKVGWECMDWSELAQDMDRSQALVKEVMKLCVI